VKPACRQAGVKGEEGRKETETGMGGRNEKELNNKVYDDDFII